MIFVIDFLKILLSSLNLLHIFVQCPDIIKGELSTEKEIKSFLGEYQISFHNFMIVFIVYCVYNKMIFLWVKQAFSNIYSPKKFVFTQLRYGHV